MVENKIFLILKQKFPDELCSNFIESFLAIIREHRKKNWKYAGNESGQFIEVARRMLEFATTSKYTPLSEKLPLFNENTLRSYEHGDISIDNSYRMLIPRYLYAMYSVRNKRGIIHKSEINPNAMDSTMLLNNAKWILAEFVRLSSNLPFEETAELIESLLEREQPIFWTIGEVTRILYPRMDSASKILCLLYYQDGQADAKLQSSIEYKNSARFKEILRKLHNDRKIEYINSDCFLSPIGLKEAEDIICRFHSAQRII